ncbi:MAG: DUF177 domain-containing protein [Kiritimatiellae bacterium]|nr:DUF177 domain-containing protein [Kiritimatiellia bacterium]
MALQTQGHLIVDVARLDKDGEEFSGETDEGLLELGDEPYITPLGGMHYRFFAHLLGSELLIQGRVWQPIRCVCRRCGADFETVAEENEFVCSIEIDAKTEYADLTDEVREAIILAFPSYPLCREGCLGLCPTCGANLNEGACSCKHSEGGNEFACLDDWLKSTPGETGTERAGRKASGKSQRK